MVKDSSAKPAKKSPDRKGFMSIRVHDDLRKLIEDSAEQDSRTMSAWVGMLLIEHFRGRGAPLDNDGRLRRSWRVPPKA